MDGVLCQNEINAEVHADDAVRFLETEFDVKVTGETVRRYLAQNGFASHAVVTKSGGFKLDAKALCEVAKEWLEHMRNTKFFDKEKSHIGSFDFTYTSQRNARRTSFLPSVVGSPNRHLPNRGSPTQLPRVFGLTVGTGPLVNYLHTIPSSYLAATPPKSAMMRRIICVQSYSNIRLIMAAFMF